MEPRRQVEREPPRASDEPKPSRVEGPRNAQAGNPPPPWRSRGFWIVLIVLLAVNCMVSNGAGHWAPGTGA